MLTARYSERRNEGKEQETSLNHNIVLREKVYMDLASKAAYEGSISFFLNIPKYPHHFLWNCLGTLCPIPLKIEAKHGKLSQLLHLHPVSLSCSIVVA